MARRWILVAWLLLIVTGALTTSLLRAPRVLSGVLSIVLVSHLIGGAAIAILTIADLLLARTPHRWWRLTLVAATAAFGWLAHRSFVPLLTASHAALAAFAAFALTELNGEAPTDHDAAPRGWISILARIGFGLVVVQVAVGAALRHHLIAFTWHLAVGGLAAMAVLAAGEVTIQHRSSRPAEKRAAISAVAAILVQAALGVTVLFMMLIGPPNAGTWIAATSGHVIVGTLALLAVGRFNHVMHRHPHATRRSERAPDA